MHQVTSSINLFGDDLEVLISYEVSPADPANGVEQEINVCRVELQTMRKWDEQGTQASTRIAMDLIPYLSEWAIREVEEVIVQENLALRARERFVNRLAA